MNCGDIDQIMAYFHFAAGGLFVICMGGAVALVWAAMKTGGSK